MDRFYSRVTWWFAFVLLTTIVTMIFISVCEICFKSVADRQRAAAAQEQADEDAKDEELKQQTIERQKAEEQQWKRLKNLKRPPTLLPAERSGQG
jgi:hypothetical protein